MQEGTHQENVSQSTGTNNQTNASEVTINTLPFEIIFGENAPRNNKQQKETEFNGSIYIS